jgi:hypothetical protein
VDREVTVPGASAEHVGGAADCTCEAKATMLAWRCRIAFSLRAEEIGKDQGFEWAVEGENLTSFPIGPDGKRAGGLAFRRRK